MTGSTRMKRMRTMAPWGLVALQAWLIDRMIKQHGRALIERERLDERLTQAERLAVGLKDAGAPAPRAIPLPAVARRSRVFPTSPPDDGDSTREGAVGFYQHLQDIAIESIPAYPSTRYAGAGIVMLAGGPRYYTSAWVSLAMLRRVLACRLPIQVWYLGSHEMSPRMIELLQRFDVECVDALEVRRQHPMRTMGGWECKPYAILHSPFKHVIFLDADSLPLIDPALLLSSAEYASTGALFWPDRYNLEAERPIWEICRVSYRDEPEFETGQMVIDKERSWDALHLTLHLNEHSDFYYQYMHGDKETFHMAWRRLARPYAMPPDRPCWTVGVISPGDPGPVGVLQQHDFDGQVIFHHRTRAKWAAWGRNFRVPGFAHDAVCEDALRELRQLWDGRVDWTLLQRLPDPEAELLRARYVLCRRIGIDERVLELLPGHTIGTGSTEWERSWYLEGEQDAPTLVIAGRARATCRLERDPDGVWRGHWLHHERMPVELRPLGAHPDEGEAAPDGSREAWNVES